MLLWFTRSKLSIKFAPKYTYAHTYDSLRTSSHTFNGSIEYWKGVGKVFRLSNIYTRKSSVSDVLGVRKNKYEEINKKGGSEKF